MLTKEVKDKYREMNMYQINNRYVEACEKGDLEVVRYLLTSKNLKNKAEIDSPSDYGDIGLTSACRYGHLDIVRYLLTSSELKIHADINRQEECALKYACVFGQLEIVQYLLISPELRYHANMHYENVFSENALIYAFKKGHINIVKYLLNSPDLKVHADIQSLGNYIFNYGCTVGNIEIIDYLLSGKEPIEPNNKIEIIKYITSSPELREYASIKIDTSIHFDVYLNRVRLTLARWHEKNPPSFQREG